MALIRFSGRIIPDAPSLSISNIPTITWRANDGDLTIALQAYVQNGLVSVDINTSRFSSDMINDIACRAYEIAHAPIDLAGFISGNGYSVVFDAITYPDGRVENILRTHSHLLPLVTVARLSDSSFYELLNFVLPTPALQRILRDLNETMQVPFVTHVNCARAIEGLRNLVADSKNKDFAWDRFREVLRLDRSYVKMITDHSRGGRHADHSDYLSPTITGEIGVRTWKITNRYFEFLKRGGRDPLPISEFPILTG